MTRSVTLRLVPLALALALEACGSTAPHDSPMTWRRATVVQIGPAEALGPTTANDCRPKGEPPGSVHPGLFAVVRYFTGRVAVQKIVPLAPDETLVPGNPIEVSRFGCGIAHAPRA